MAGQNPPLSFFNELAKEYNKLYNECDLDKIADVYTENAMWLDNGNPVEKGREAIKKLVKGLHETIGPHELNHWYEDYLLSGDIASCRGRFTMKDKSDKQIAQGNTFVVFHRLNGKWLIHYDMFAMQK